MKRLVLCIVFLLTLSLVFSSCNLINEIKLEMERQEGNQPVKENDQTSLDDSTTNGQPSGENQQQSELEDPTGEDQQDTELNSDETGSGQESNDPPQEENGSDTASNNSGNYSNYHSYTHSNASTPADPPQEDPVDAPHTHAWDEGVETKKDGKIVYLFTCEICGEEKYEDKSSNGSGSGAKVDFGDLGW